MFSIRTAVLLSAAFLCAPWLGWGASDAHQAEYLGGTVKTIPVKTAGSLDLTSPAELRFRHGKSVYRLPYDQIKSVHFEDPKTAHHKLAHVPLPKMPLRGREQVLDLSFRDADGGIGTLSFRLSSNARETMEWALNQRLDSENARAHGANRTKLPESWWGDKYWKTNRNKGAWPDPQTDTAIAASGTH